LFLYEKVEDLIESDPVLLRWVFVRYRANKPDLMKIGRHSERCIVLRMNFLFQGDVHFELHFKRSGKFASQKLARPEAAEFSALGHDGHLCAEGFCLLHGVGAEHYGAVPIRSFGDN